MGVTAVILVLIVMYFYSTIQYNREQSNRPQVFTDEHEDVYDDLFENHKLPDEIKSWKIPSKVSTIDYNSYIRSDAWKFNAARQKALARDDYKCKMCDCDYKVEVHHINYDNLGNEKIEDLVCLCSVCHSYTHRISGKGALLYPPYKSPLRT